jgi:cysteine dioxygenase
MAGKLDSLLAYLNGMHERPGLAELEALLHRLNLGRADVAKWVRFSDRAYQRNLVHAGDRYHLWVLCWRNGQRSPIHDHAGSACAVRILEGTATVTFFERTRNGHIKAVASEDYPAGQVVVSADEDIHQVSNLQGDDADLITLHIYTPPLLRMGVYSILERTRGEEVWELIGGAGI